MNESGPCKRYREERGATHCWHSTGEVLTSYPPQYPQFCCWCDAKRRLSGTVPQPDNGHGPCFEHPATARVVQSQSSHPAGTQATPQGEQRGTTPSPAGNGNAPSQEQCPKREDGLHCEHWQDGGACHDCGAAPMTDAERADQGMELKKLFPPEGWKLVPVKPTTVMDNEAYASLPDRWRHIGFEVLRNAYRAMLAAAPEVPSTGPRPPTHRLVPRVPTAAMVDALDDCLADCHDSRQALILAIDAAPEVA